MEHEYKIGEMVSWRSGGKTFYGRIYDLEGDSAVIGMYGHGHWGEKRHVLLSKLTYEPPVVLSAEDLARFARYEIGYNELIQGRTFADIEVPEPYQIVPEDLKAAVIRYHEMGIDAKTFAEDYYFPLDTMLYDDVGMETALDGPDEEAEELPPPNRYTVFSTALGTFVHRLDYGDESHDLDDVITEVQTWEDNRDKPFSEREYTRAQKQSFLKYWNEVIDDDAKRVEKGKRRVASQLE